MKPFKRIIISKKQSKSKKITITHNQYLEKISLYLNLFKISSSLGNDFKRIRST